MAPGFTPLSDYGAVGNDDRCVLVSRHGSIDWCCLPHLESPSVFGAILDDRNGGHFSIRPAESYEAEQEYLDRTNVLQTTFRTDTGQVTVTDFMPTTDPDELHALYQQALYRRVTCDEGPITLDVEFCPRFDYARAPTTVEADEHGLVASSGDEELRLLSDADFRISPDSSMAAATLRFDDQGAESETTEADEVWFGIQYGHDVPLSEAEYESLLDATIDYWHEWVDECDQRLFEGPWSDAVIRSALALKLLIHEQTGAIAAAATASLPEEIGGERNWDYRYNWIRDAKFTVQALYNLGRTEEAHRYFDWFREVSHADPAEIQPLYGLHADSTLDEQTLDHLSGYRHSRPIRIGNAAAVQRQLDVYGVIVQGIYETVRHDGTIDTEDWESLCAIVDHVTDVWDEPDAGIWEFRTDPRHYVHSKLLCWVALDRGIRLAEQTDRDAPTDHWIDVRDSIKEAILDRGFSESANSFVQYFDAETALDATSLLVPIYGLLPPDDDRVQGTIDAALDRLTTEDGLVYRFVDSEIRPDEPTGFVLCSFWLIDALVLAERTEKAEELFTELLDHASPLGLYAERIHPDTGAHLGNFPQAFSHIGLINSAIYLSAVINGDEDGGRESTEYEPEEFDSDDTLFRQ